MVDTAMNVTQNVCKKPMVKDCDIEGEPVCRTEYQSECWSKQIPHEVEDDVAECVTVQDRMCKEETSGYTTKEKCEDWPRQECTLEPVKTCKHITRLVPKLVEVQECVDVPKEICNRSKQNPRKVKKPIIKNWCYTPAEDNELQNL